MNGIAHIDNRPSGPSSRKGWWTAVLLGGCIGSVILLTPMASFAQTIWRGSGQIINGRGNGGRLELIMETHNGRIRTRSGPNLNASFRRGGSQTVQNREGTWQIEHQGNLLNVTLYRESQVIRYRLRSDEPVSDSPRSRNDENSGSNSDFPIEELGDISLDTIEIESSGLAIPNSF